MRRRALWITAATLAALGLAWALVPAPHPVELARVSSGPLRVTVSATGKARVRNRFVVAAPVTGAQQRVALRPGDPVTAGQVLTTLEPLAAMPLDARSHAEAQGRVNTAEALLEEAQAVLEKAGLAKSHAQRQWERASALASQQVLAPRDLEEAQLEREVHDREVVAAEQGLRRARAELAASRAVLQAHEGRSMVRGIPVTAPTSGRVLRVLKENAGPVEAGTPLVELGDPAELEVSLELLSSEAVRVAPGSEVTLERWGGAVLTGVVAYVEPSAYTKVSALGVEEQRVDVVVRPRGDWTGLADGYQVEGRIVVTESEQVLQVPVSALVRKGSGWGAYVVIDGRATLRSVEIGAMAETHAEVRTGLGAGDTVVVHPSDTLADGHRVEEEPRIGAR